MKKIFLIITLLALTQWSFGQTKQDFCKKWKLSGYIYWYIHFPPEANEKNDYIHFKSDNTFVSKDEGKVESGTWKWNAKQKKIYCYEKGSSEPLPFEVISVSKSKLVMRIKDDDGDSITVVFKI